LISKANEIASKQKPACEIHFQLSDRLPRLKPNVELMLFRIAQEGINNALKHAQATRITVQLRQTAADSLVLQKTYFRITKGAKD
ncbi:MAG: hypothetical protein ABL921_35575, partial [Pirellula sp.]